MNEQEKQKYLEINEAVMQIGNEMGIPEKLISGYMNPISFENLREANEKLYKRIQL